MWCSLVSVITTLYYVVIIFHGRVWYRALSLRYSCILILQASFVPNFVSFAASIAELATEKSHTQSLTHPACLMPWEPKSKIQQRQRQQQQQQLQTHFFILIPRHS